jgi:hypothetical protein
MCRYLLGASFIPVVEDVAALERSAAPAPDWWVICGSADRKVTAWRAAISTAARRPPKEIAMTAHPFRPDTRKGKVRVTRFFAANDEIVAIPARSREPGAPASRYQERIVDVESVIAGCAAVGALCLLCLLLVEAFTAGWFA